MQQLWEDLRVGFRVMRANPAFCLLPVFILSMGMGGAVMLFSYINAWIIQPIEYPEPDRLVYLKA